MAPSSPSMFSFSFSPGPGGDSGPSPAGSSRSLSAADSHVIRLSEVEQHHAPSSTAKMNAVGGEEGTRNEPVAENKSYGNVNDDDDDEELAKISELEATPKPPQAAQERVRLFCGCAGPEVSRKTRLVTLSVCGVVSFLAVAAVVTIVAIWSTIKQVKDFRSCWINICDHGVEVSDAKIVDMGNITRFAEVANDASFSCAKSFEESTRDGTGKVYAAVTVYNPNPYEARIVNTVVHIDATPEIPVGSDNALALKLKDLSARVMECEVPSIRVKKGDNLVAATCTIFLKDTVLGRSMQAYLDGYKVNLKQRAMARVNVLGIRDFKMDETTDLVLAPTTLHPSYLPPGSMPPPPAPLGIVANNNNNDFFGNTAKCPGTTDLHFDLPTVFVCGIYFTNSVASTLTSMIGSVMGNSDSGVDVELDGTIALHNPTAFPVVVQYAQVRMIHDDGATVARLADSIIVPSNYTELLVFRASVPASEATAVASKLLEGRLRMNVTGQIDIAMLTTEFTINIKETPVIASEMDEEFSSAMGGTHRRALAQQSELELGSKGSAYDIALSLAQGKCLCVYHCGSDAEHSTMLSLRNTTTRDNVTPKGVLTTRSFFLTLTHNASRATFGACLWWGRNVTRDLRDDRDTTVGSTWWRVRERVACQGFPSPPIPSHHTTPRNSVVEKSP